MCPLSATLHTITGKNFQPFSAFFYPISNPNIPYCRAVASNRRAEALASVKFWIYFFFIWSSRKRLCVKNKSKRKKDIWYCRGRILVWLRRCTVSFFEFSKQQDFFFLASWSGCRSHFSYTIETFKIIEWWNQTYFKWFFSSVWKINKDVTFCRRKMSPWRLINTALIVSVTRSVVIMVLLKVTKTCQRTLQRNFNLKA